MPHTRISQARASAGMSLPEAAAALSISDERLQALESGRTPVLESGLAKIAALYGVSTAWLREPLCAGCGRSPVVLMQLEHVHSNGERVEWRLCTLCYLPEPTLGHRDDQAVSKPAKRSRR